MRNVRTRWFLGTLAISLAAIALYVQQTRAQQYGAPVGMAVPSQQSPEYFAGNLGIYYRLVPQYNGYPGSYASAPAPGTYGQVAPIQQAPTSYGARITRYPVPNSPAAILGFEPGDMILTLDNMAIFGPNDVFAHRWQTCLLFVNVRTGLPQQGDVYIP